MGGGKVPFDIPDWKQYKTGGIKELEWVERSLAAKGLKDPWLRNEVWRYQNFPGIRSNAILTAFRGFKYAFAAMVVTVAVDTAFGISKKWRNRRGHGDHYRDS